jgi:hypothetical protein
MEEPGKLKILVPRWLFGGFPPLLADEPALVLFY